MLHPAASVDVLVRGAVDELPEAMRTQAAAMASEARHGDEVRIRTFPSGRVVTCGGIPVEQPS